jgi:hypothetical protein
MNWKVIFVSALLLVGWPVFYNEKHRYTHALHDCMESYIKNEHTLSKDVCANVEERERCSESIRRSCLQAERDNRVSPHDCAYAQWFQESSVVQLYIRLTDSTWALLCMGTIVVLGAMYFLVQYKTTENSHIRMVDTFGRELGLLKQKREPAYLTYRRD